MAFYHSGYIADGKQALQKQDSDFRRVNIETVIPGADNFGETVTENNLTLASKAVEQAFGDWRSFGADRDIIENESFDVGALALVTSFDKENNEITHVLTQILV